MVYDLTKGERFARDFGLRGQVQRAAVSVMANIAEGFERQSRKEFRNFLSIALGSCAEVRSHLYVALDQGYIEKPAFKLAYEQAEAASRLIFGFMKRLADSISD
jgi:four helix bundle protein